jgi:hypothetical protein
MRSEVVVTAWRSAAVVLALVLSAMPALAQKALVSVKTDQAPTIDGTVDAAWEKAPAYKIALIETPYKPEGFKGITKTNVTMKSMYDKDNIYVLLQWEDPTRSIERAPWVKQPDGKWKQLKAADQTGHDNTYYEDKLALLWNINAKEFEKKGCEVACHKARGGKVAGIDDKSPGRKFTDKPGETIDMWHWKSVRTGPVGQVDDQYIDDTKDPTKNADWGRKGDAKTGGGYADNVNKDKTGPAWMNKTPSEENKYWVLDDQKTEFVDTFKPGDVVGGIVIAPFHRLPGRPRGPGRVEERDVDARDQAQARDYGREGQGAGRPVRRSQEDLLLRGVGVRQQPDQPRLPRRRSPADLQVAGNVALGAPPAAFRGRSPTHPGDSMVTDRRRRRT